MLKTHYQISLGRLLAVTVMVLIYVHLLINWQILYWVNESFFLNYLALAVAAEEVSTKATWPSLSLGVWFEAIAYVSPLLLLSRGLGARLIFYIVFFVCYFLPVEPYQSVVVIGALDSSIYTIVVGAVGVLLGSDIYRINRNPNRVSRKINSKTFQLITFAFAVMVVFVSSLVNNSEAALVLDTAKMLDNYGLDSVQLHMPFLQAAVFILLATGVFINSRAQAAFIVLSWVVLILPWGFRLEWFGYYFVADTYAFLSGILLWSSVAPEQRPEKHCQ